MKFKYYLLTALLFIAPATYADEHYIDRYLESCINADSTTAGMVNCTNQAYFLWDKELNIKYINLMSLLPFTEKQVLRNAQRQWIAFRDLEFALIDSQYKRKEGSLYYPMRAADRLEIVKARVLQLAGYISLAKE